MKKIYATLIITICGKFLFAQLQPEMKLNQERFHKLLKQNGETVVGTDSLFQEPSEADTARYSHSTLQGDIYLLPQDNTPCLRPGNAFVNNMPVKRSPNKTGLIKAYRFKNNYSVNPPVNGGQMPNAYTGKPLVWEKKP